MTPMYIKETITTLNLAELVKEITIGEYLITDATNVTVQMSEMYLSLYSHSDYRIWKIYISGYCEKTLDPLTLTELKEINIKYNDRQMNGGVYAENWLQRKNGTVEFSLIGRGALTDVLIS